MMDTIAEPVLRQAAAKERASAPQAALAHSEEVSASPRIVTWVATDDSKQNEPLAEEPQDKSKEEFKQAADRWPLAATGHG